MRVALSEASLPRARPVRILLAVVRRAVRTLANVARNIAANQALWAVGTALRSRSIGCGPFPGPETRPGTPAGPSVHRGPAEYFFMRSTRHLTSDCARSPACSANGAGPHDGVVDGRRDTGPMLLPPTTLAQRAAEEWRRGDHERQAHGLDEVCAENSRRSVVGMGTRVGWQRAHL